MIIGHGIDLIDIRRIDRTIDRFGERFIKEFSLKMKELDQIKSKKE